MKISKFKETDTYEDILHKEEVEQKLDNIKTQDSTNHAEAQQKLDTHHEEIKQTLSGIQPRSDRTKIYNQKIEEDFIILETTDELMRPAETCKGIFDTTEQLSEVNQFFVLEESVDDNRCSERKHNFDTDTKHAFRLDQYSGDPEGYFDIYGHIENNSSDIHLINDTLYKIKLKLDDDPQFVSLDDGFTLSFNDIEKENILSCKRDHTISGYTFNYIIESKANS